MNAVWRSEAGVRLVPHQHFAVRLKWPSSDDHMKQQLLYISQMESTESTVAPVAAERSNNYCNVVHLLLAVVQVIRALQGVNAGADLQSCSSELQVSERLRCSLRPEWAAASSRKLLWNLKEGEVVLKVSVTSLRLHWWRNVVVYQQHVAQHQCDYVEGLLLDQNLFMCS